MSIAIGYMPGAFGEDAEDPNYLRRMVAVGDKHGYDSIWLSDRVVSNRFSLEPITALSMVAAYSPQMKFGTSVLALPLRNPVVLAKQIATLDFLSRGRMLLAVGLGQEEPQEYEACGVPKEARGLRTEEAIHLMRRLWEEDEVTHEGEFFSCHNISVTPKPWFKPSPPVWIGGRSPAAAKRVGRIGDGWLVSAVTPQEVRNGREIIFDTAAKYARTIEADHIGVLVGYYIADHAEETVSRAYTHITRLRQDAHITEYSALGTPERISEILQRYIDAGASKFVVRPLCPANETVEQLDIMGSEILPQFHR